MGTTLKQTIKKSNKTLHSCKVKIDVSKKGIKGKIQAYKRLAKNPNIAVRIEFYDSTR